MVAISAAACALLALDMFAAVSNCCLRARRLHRCLFHRDPCVADAGPEFFREAQRAGDGDALPQELHRFYQTAYQLDAIRRPPIRRWRDLTPDVIPREPGHDPEYPPVGSRARYCRPSQQTQAIRLYYQFYNVAIDRYHLADGYHQVMLSTRELSQELASGGADLGQPVSAVHPRLRPRHELRLQDRRRRVSAISARERPRRIQPRAEDHATGDLLRTSRCRATGSSTPASRSSTIPRAMTTSTPAMRERAAFPWTASGSAYCSPGPRATSTSC